MKPELTIPDRSVQVTRGGMILPLKSIQRAAIEEVLRLCGGNKTLAAEKLGIAKKTLYNKLNQYELDDYEKANRKPKPWRG